MLKEFLKLRQVENIRRRLFTDNYFDLYLWYQLKTNNFIGFQLIFKVNGAQMALTAEVDKVPDIYMVDSGDDLFYDPSDVLDKIGYFPKDDLYNQFNNRSNTLEKDIRNNILKVIKTYKLDINDSNIFLEPLY